MDQEESSPISQEEIEEAEDEQEENAEDAYEENLELQKDYMAPEPEEKHNQFTIIDKALKAQDTVRSTFLTEQELGRPLFSVRFYMDYHDLSQHYLNNTLARLGLDPKEWNFVANYFQNKYQNITDSGMSNKGFTMNIAVTQKRDTIKKRVREVNKDYGGKAKP